MRKQIQDKRKEKMNQGTEKNLVGRWKEARHVWSHGNEVGLALIWKTGFTPPLSRLPVLAFLRDPGDANELDEGGPFRMKGPQKRIEWLLLRAATLIASCLKNMQLKEILLQAAPICCFRILLIHWKMRVVQDYYGKCKLQTVGGKPQTHTHTHTHDLYGTPRRRGEDT